MLMFARYLLTTTPAPCGACLYAQVTGNRVQRIPTIRYLTPSISAACFLPLLPCFRPGPTLDISARLIAKLPFFFSQPFTLLRDCLRRTYTPFKKTWVPALRTPKPSASRPSRTTRHN
ncbi:hypothetical protein EV127DRAFT_156420 [Xylaria flabelliformis]|nr:hypothetical protein EV127DRAFT_156420 [Xylaria flabelliformis]